MKIATRKSSSPRAACSRVYVYMPRVSRFFADSDNYHRHFHNSRRTDDDFMTRRSFRHRVSCRSCSVVIRNRSAMFERGRHSCQKLFNDVVFCIARCSPVLIFSTWALTIEHIHISSKILLANYLNLIVRVNSEWWQ